MLQSGVPTIDTGTERYTSPTEGPTQLREYVRYVRINLTSIVIKKFSITVEKTIFCSRRKNGGKQFWS